MLTMKNLRNFVATHKHVDDETVLMIAEANPSADCDNTGFPIDRIVGTVVDIQLPNDAECDINLIFPNGKVMSLQYRLEAPSIDVCFEEKLHVTNWKDNMEPADAVSWPEHGVQDHIRDAVQLVIDFPPDWLNDDEK